MRLQLLVDDGERREVLREFAVRLPVPLVDVAVVHGDGFRAAARVAPVVAARQDPQLLGVRVVEVDVQDVLSAVLSNIPSAGQVQYMSCASDRAQPDEGAIQDQTSQQAVPCSLRAETETVVAQKPNGVGGLMNK